jgi:hypothetical protein
MTESRRNHQRQSPPMSLAEAAECCGQYRWDASGAPCSNCPLLIERRENPDVMQAARAM